MANCSVACHRAAANLPDVLSQSSGGSHFSVAADLEEKGNAGEEQNNVDHGNEEEDDDDDDDADAVLDTNPVEASGLSFAEGDDLTNPDRDYVFPGK